MSENTLKLVKDGDHEKVEPIQPIIPEETPRTIDFPVEALPKVMGDLVQAGKYALQIPHEFFAIPALVAAATAIGSEYEIAVNRTLSTKAILYACLIASAGSGKSPAQQIAMKPIHSIQKKKMEEYTENYIQYAEEKKAYDAKKKKLKKDEVLTEDCPNPPKPHEVLTTDATFEALAKMLESNKKGVVIIQDEFLRFYNSLDSYRGGKGGDLQNFLTLWNGSSIKINRVSKGFIYLEEPYVSILGAMTPSGISQISENDNSENGFLDRFLFAYPTDVGMMRTTDAGISEDAERAYHKMIAKLMEPHVMGGTEKISLNESAQRVYMEYEDKLIEEAGKSEKKRSIYSKIKMYSLRFALIIHLCEQVDKHEFDWENTVSEESMIKAIKLAEYFKEQTRKVYHKLTETPQDEIIIKAVNMLRMKSIDRKISQRDIQRNLTMKTTELTKLLGELKDRQIIAEIERKTVGGGERIVYAINPEIF